MNKKFFLFTIALSVGLVFLAFPLVNLVISLLLLFLLPVPILAQFIATILALVTIALSSLLVPRIFFRSWKYSAVALLVLAFPFLFNWFTNFSLLRGLSKELDFTEQKAKEAEIVITDFSEKSSIGSDGKIKEVVIAFSFRTNMPDPLSIDPVLEAVAFRGQNDEENVFQLRPKTARLNGKEVILPQDRFLSSVSYRVKPAQLNTVEFLIPATEISSKNYISQNPKIAIRGSPVFRIYHSDPLAYGQGSIGIIYNVVYEKRSPTDLSQRHLWQGAKHDLSEFTK